MMLPILTEPLKQRCSCQTPDDIDPQTCPTAWHTFRMYSNGRPLRRAIAFCGKDGSRQMGTFKLNLPSNTDSQRMISEAQELGYRAVIDEDLSSGKRVIITPPTEPTDQQLEHMKTWIRHTLPTSSS